MFLDSIKSHKPQKTNDKSRVYILLTPSECGGLPLGVILTSTNNKNALSNGFEILKDMLGEKIFGGKPNGPKIFITDDNEVEIEAVKTSFTESENLLCIYHVLRSIFKWLVKVKNAIEKSKQQLFFQEFRSIMFAKTKTECLDRYNTAKSSAGLYPSYLSILNDYWDRRHLWALSYRSYFLSEASLRLLKEQIFERVKSFNIIQTLDFIITKFMVYYETKLLDAAEKNEINYFVDKDHPLPPPEIVERTQNLGDKLFLVPCDKQENLFYVVNTEILSCSCTNSTNGELCKHVEWLLASEPTIAKESIANNSMRKIFYYIATGEEVSDDWLDSKSKLI